MNLLDLSHEIVSRDSHETGSGIVSQSHSLLKGVRLRQIPPTPISAFSYVAHWNSDVAPQPAACCDKTAYYACKTKPLGQTSPL